MTSSNGLDTHAGPAVSIVIPAYNAAPYIGDTLESVFAQTFDDYEVIVVNDGSPDTDDLQRVLKSYRSRIKYLEQNNRGVSAARNTGIRSARGRYYAQLDADDQWEPHYLAVQVGILTNNPAIDLVYPNAVYFGETSEVGLEFMKASPSNGDVTLERLITQQCVVMTSVVARLSTIVRAGLFDESLPCCEDFDLWLRIVHGGGRIAYHRHKLVRYRRHHGSLSSDRVRMVENLLSVFAKVKRSMNLTPDQNELVEKEIERCTATLALLKAKQAFTQREMEQARTLLTDANLYFKSHKLSLTTFLLRYTPNLLLATFQARERIFERLKQL
jgi:glycosyltransferase involved in cell wall biosynthesis